VNPTKHLDGPFVYNDLKKPYHNLITNPDRHTLWMIRTQPSKQSKQLGGPFREWAKETLPPLNNHVDTTNHTLRMIQTEPSAWVVMKSYVNMLWNWNTNK
jgi:hypothetical protein